jgi:hypothetical protein
MMTGWMRFSVLSLLDDEFDALLTIGGLANTVHELANAISISFIAVSLIFIQERQHA